MDVYFKLLQTRDSVAMRPNLPSRKIYIFFFKSIFTFIKYYQQKIKGFHEITYKKQ